MSTYEPGTVAIATVRGVPNVRVVRSGSTHQHWWTPEYMGDDQGSEPQWRIHYDRHVTDIRPLVVLDLTPNACGWSSAEALVGDLRGDGFHKVAAQIEAQTKPPRIPEPVLWGVVKAGGTEHVSVGPDCWIGVADGKVRTWASLKDPTLVRDGIEDAS